MKLFVRLATPVALAALLALPAQAPAEVPHTVQAGETLWSIAAANNFTTRALAAANGLPEDAQVVAGTTIQIPSEAEAAAALGATAAPAPRRRRSRRPGARDERAPRAGRLHRRSPATRCRTSPPRTASRVGQLAWMNGLDPAAPLLVGTALKLPTSAPQARGGAGHGGGARGRPGCGAASRCRRTSPHRRSARSPRATASRRRWRPRSRGRRAASRTAWSRRPTRAA